MNLSNRHHTHLVKVKEQWQAREKEKVEKERKRVEVQVSPFTQSVTPTNPHSVTPTNPHSVGHAHKSSLSRSRLQILLTIDHGVCLVLQVLVTSFAAKEPVQAVQQRLVWECGCVRGEEVWLCGGDGKLGVVSAQETLTLTLPPNSQVGEQCMVKGYFQQIF